MAIQPAAAAGAVSARGAAGSGMITDVVASRCTVTTSFTDAPSLVISILCSPVATLSVAGERPALMPSTHTCAPAGCVRTCKVPVDPAGRDDADDEGSKPPSTARPAAAAS